MMAGQAAERDRDQAAERDRDQAVDLAVSSPESAAGGGGHRHAGGDAGVFRVRPRRAPVGPAPIDDPAVQSQAEAVATVSLASRAVDKLGLATIPSSGCGGRRPLPVRD